MKNATNFIIITVAVIAVLVVGKGILIPFLFALIFWFFTREIRQTIYKIPYAKRFIPKWLCNIFVFSLIILGFGFISEIITGSITDLTTSYSTYEPNVETIIKNLSSYFHVDVVTSIKSLIGDFNYGSVLGNIANGVSSLLGDTFMILIYALFIFLEESSLIKKSRKIFPTEESYNHMNTILEKIEFSISNYLRLKTYVSLLTGVLSYFVLVLVGVDSAPFWAFLIFLLNYIPTIGSLVATVFPAFFCLIQFGELTPFLIVLITVGAVQVIVSLAIWGNIWGITGMVLSVPITVIMIIVFSQFDKTKSIAIILSENGEVDEIRKG